MSDSSEYVGTSLEAANGNQPPLELTIDPGKPGWARVRMDRIMSLDTATSIALIIKAADQADSND